MKATLLEGLEARHGNFEQLNAETNPDVLVLIEVTGLHEAKGVAAALGWTDYQAVVTNLNVMKDNAFFALELAVLSKIKIDRAVEFDAPKGDGTHPAFGAGSLAGNLPAVSEQPLTNTLLPTLGEFTAGDRGTMRVDLSNGLTIFPVHLKSNSNGACIEIDNARSAIRSQDGTVAEKLDHYFNQGFRKATEEHVTNAAKRERMIATVLNGANKAAAEDRTVLIAGDFNTAFEEGKFGKRLDDDCALRDFSCKKGPSPREACPKRDGDGFDDTLSILESPLIGGRSWTFLTRTLGRTYDDDAFADLAIHHMAVPAEQASLFSVAKKSEGQTFGSDHFAVFTEFRSR